MLPGTDMLDGASCLLRALSPRSTPRFRTDARRLVRCRVSSNWREERTRSRRAADGRGWRARRSKRGERGRTAGGRAGQASEWCSLLSSEQVSRLSVLGTGLTTGWEGKLGRRWQGARGDEPAGAGQRGQRTRQEGLPDEGFEPATCLGSFLVQRPRASKRSESAGPTSAALPLRCVQPRTSTTPPPLLAALSSPFPLQSSLPCPTETTPATPGAA